MALGGGWLLCLCSVTCSLRGWHCRNIGLACLRVWDQEPETGGGLDQRWPVWLDGLLHRLLQTGEEEGIFACQLCVWQHFLPEERLQLGLHVQYLPLLQFGVVLEMQMSQKLVIVPHFSSGKILQAPKIDCGGRTRSSEACLCTAVPCFGLSISVVFFSTFPLSLTCSHWLALIFYVPWDAFTPPTERYASFVPRG